MTADLGPIGVFGAGAIGCYVGGMLKAAGADVRFLGREHVAATLRENGLTLSRFDGPQVFVKPEDIVISTDPSILSDCDIILLCVKSQATPEAAVDMASRMKSGACVVSLQNGVDNAKTLADALGPERVCPAMVPFNVLSSGNGNYHRGTAGDLLMADTPKTRELSVLLTRAGIIATTRTDMNEVLWGKLLLNLNNALNVLSDIPLVEQLSNRAYRLVLADMVSEALAAIGKAGIRPAAIGKVRPWLIPLILRLPDWLFMRVAQSMLAMDAKARSSMWDDLKNGRQPEIDFLNGAVVRLAGEVGTPAPINRKVIALVEEAFKSGHSPGFSGEEILRLPKGGVD
ncbi:2-dehydropantoate 2-reductase [Hoeflea poritis]|uniref:2-dehydropantoate 2-reductase n=1 Tax=Hoeflea poritis TaxID=2993659 RepID=A0ABT4VGJ9_9HYPH|nr:2-dehydropantoate 2-reductase [Hoeflea poritis]MDA4843829.1 2-dehydropantoate 2-reductase [Hoeflea poritis]